MATPVDNLTPTNYTQLSFITYNTLQDKLDALFRGEVLLIKDFEQKEGADVLIQLVQSKFTVTQISYSTRATALQPVYWTTYNVGINDLSLMTTFKYDEQTFLYENRFMINDTIQYVNSFGVQDSAIVTAVYVSNTDPTQFAYELSNDNVGIYAEADLVQDTFM